MTAAITDFTQFASLRSGAEKNDPAVLREVAGQFEALFIQSILENMRASELADPLLGGSDQHKMMQGMLDQQLSMEMASGRGIGLADMLVQQLGGDAKAVNPTRESFSLTAPPRAMAKKTEATWESPREFAHDVWPHVERVAAKLNVAPEGLLAQTALETGWGAHVMQRTNGVSSYNLFGIKAGSDWSGSTVSRSTLEYTDGIAQRKVERFKAYPDLAASFNDYAALIEDNPRYEMVLDHGSDSDGFATALQDAGYATDPSYASKIGGIVRSTTLRTAISGLKFGAMAPIGTERTSAIFQ
jgi:flagellar protein FlgJ